MITQDIGKRKQMFRKYVRNIWRNLLTNICSTLYNRWRRRNKCSCKTVLKNRWRGTGWIQKRIYWESRGSNYTGYNRASIRRKKKLVCEEVICWYFFLIMILGLSAFYGSGLVSAHDNAKDNSIRYKYYKSIQIHSGDTFGILPKKICLMIMNLSMIILQKWKRFNKLSSDQIQDSQYLMVPYYELQMIF